VEICQLLFTQYNGHKNFALKKAFLKGYPEIAGVDDGPDLVMDFEKRLPPSSDLSISGGMSYNVPAISCGSEEG